jgi:hypothetical protein
MYWPSIAGIATIFLWNDDDPFLFRRFIRLLGANRDTTRQSAKHYCNHKQLQIFHESYPYKSFFVIAVGSIKYSKTTAETVCYRTFTVQFARFLLGSQAPRGNFWRTRLCRQLVLAFIKLPSDQVCLTPRRRIELYERDSSPEIAALTSPKIKVGQTEVKGEKERAVERWCGEQKLRAV